MGSFSTRGEDASASKLNQPLEKHPAAHAEQHHALHPVWPSVRTEFPPCRFPSCLPTTRGINQPNLSVRFTSMHLQQSLQQQTALGPSHQPLGTKLEERATNGASTHLLIKASLRRGATGVLTGQKPHGVTGEGGEGGREQFGADGAAR